MGTRSRCLARRVRSVTRREEASFDAEAEGPPYTASGGLREAELAAVVEMVAAEEEEEEEEEGGEDAVAKERQGEEAVSVQEREREREEE